MKAKKIATMGILAAMTLVLGYVESLIPMDAAIPGIKLGISNTVLIYAVYTLGIKESFMLALFKVVLSGFLFGSPSAMMFSAAGALVSLLAMIPLSRIKSLSIIGVSIAGAAGHNIGQCAVACFVVTLRAALSYMPLLLVSGIITGALTGVAAKYVIKYINIKANKNFVGGKK